MDYFDVINKRFSCRSFLPKKITKEELNKVLNAGILAPTAVNFQPERIGNLKFEVVNIHL